MRVQNIISVAIILLSFAASFILYPSMPDVMPIHWNAEGNIDGYGSKCLALFIMPCVSLFVFLLFLVIPKIEVYKSHVEEIMPKLSTLILILICFFSVLYVTTILSASGYVLDVARITLFAMSILFFYIAYLLKDVKRNFFVGIRTPWTLSSDKVWKKTHLFGSKLFYVVSFLLLINAFLPVYSFWFMLILLLGSVIAVFVYSFVEFKKLRKR